MPYNETFEKLKAAQDPAFAEEIEAVKDNQTFFIGAYELSPEGNIPRGDFNEIFQALLNNDKALKKLAEAIQARTITAGKGLQGGGNLTTNRTIDVVSADDSITVGADNIKVNIYNGVDSTSITRPGSAKAVKQAYDKGKEGLDKANEKVSKAGDVMTGELRITNASLRVTVSNDDVSLGFYNDTARIRVGGTSTGASNGFNIEGQNNKVLFRVDNNAELYAGTRQVYHTGNFDPDLKQNKTDSSLKTTSKETTGAINEEYDFARFSLYDGAITPDPKNQGSEYYKYIRSTFVDTLSALRDAKKLPRLIYFEPQWFTDTADWNYPSSRYEAVVLYAGAYGVKCVVNSPADANDTRIIYSWNPSDRKKLFSYKIDGYSSGVNAPYEFIQDNIIKSEGKGYIDKTSNKLYYCYKQAPATITSPDADYFIPATNVELAKGKTIITFGENYVVEKYDNGLMIQYGIWQEDSRVASKFPIPFVKGFSTNRQQTGIKLPLICGATGYGSASDSTISVKLYTPNTDLTQISFVINNLGTVAYTAVGYWK